jgi:hypothetical protein
MSTDEKLPEPSFDVLLQVLAGPCFVHLGLVPNPETGAASRDLEQARWCLDLLHVFEEKVRGNLSKPEREITDHLLHELRQVYSSARGTKG